MTIGFDGKRATHNSTGLGNYSRDLITSCANFFTKDQWIVFSPEKGHFQLYLDSYQNIHFRFPSGINKLFPGFWRQFNMMEDLKSSGIELFHGLSHQLPYGINKTGIKSVVTIHDLIFIRYPHLYSFADRNIHLLKVKYACSVADRIIAISDATKKDLIKFLNIDPVKITVIPPSCNSVFKKNLSDQEIDSFKKAQGINYKFILSVGTIETRKNHELIVEAANLLRNEVKFIFIGKKGDAFDPLQKLINKYKLNDQFIFKTNVSLKDLSGFYQAAEFSIYSSVYEGFGLPALESISCGTPVISIKNTSMEEAAGPGGIYVAGDSPDELAKKIEQLLTVPELKSKLIDQGLNHAIKFNPEFLAGKLNELYQEVLA